MIRANSSLVTWEFRRKRFGATTGLALARAVACDPIDSWWISTAAGLIFPAADVGFVGEDLCEASHVHRVATA
jgi:hypothetical protein